MNKQTDNSGEVRELKVEVRKGRGKGVARKLRRAGRVPGVFYGMRHEPVSVSLSPGELVQALSTPKLRNTLLRMVSEDNGINGRLALVKDIQRHPLNRDFLHIDLIEVYPEIPVKANVPINLHGHPQGVDQGGTLEQHLRYVEIRCPAQKIPAELTVDVSSLEIGHSTKLGEIVIGEGIELLDDEHLVVASVAAPRVLEVAAPVEGEVAEEGAAEAAEGEAEAGADKAAEKKEAKKETKKETKKEAKKEKE